VAHDNRTGKQRDYSRKAKQLSDQIGDVSRQQDEAGLLDRVPVEGLVHFEQVAESEARNGSNGDTEKHQN
jgi:hypothetical protein